MTFQPEKADAFRGQLIGIYNGAATALMISIGHRTNLFDVLANTGETTSVDLAKRAELDERYVREWLGSMVTARIVDYDPATTRYRLPAEHAAFLTRAASPNNRAVSSQFISLLGGVEDQVVDCFRNGGGVPYSQYPRFHEVMAEESTQTIVSALEAHILPLVPGLVDKLENGIEVLDVGCGRGRAMLTLAARFPNSRFTGVDFSQQAVKDAEAEAERRGVSNLRFEVRDAGNLGDCRRYDLITAFDAIHDQVEPDRTLAGIASALKDDGFFLAQDIKGSSVLEKNLAHPLAPYLFAISCMHCMTVSLSAGGAGLGAMWGREKAVSMMAEAGFTSIDVKELPHDILNYYYVASKG